MKPETIITGTPVTLSELLDARSRRARRQKELLCRPGAHSLISFSMNMPGEIKRFPLLLSAFEEGLKAIREQIPLNDIRHYEEARENTGPEALFLLSSEAAPVKRITASIEENHTLGRLFDMDVLDTSGVSLSRSTLGLPPRTCLVCGENAKICARSKRHSMELILWRIARILNDYFRNQAADLAAACAVRSLLYEVSAAPKPGLVDRNNSGSHRDMDFFTFLDSSAALIPWFRDFFCIGWDCRQETEDKLFDRLRFAGQQAEKSMFSATGGINTHKGLVFSFAILCGALGNVHAGIGSPLNSRDVISLCQRLGAYSLPDFLTPSSKTAGEQCHDVYGITGARGEAAAGFPSALTLGLPALKHWLHEGFSLNDSSVLALLTILTKVDDTNMIHRGGRAMALECKKEAADILSDIAADSFKEKLTALDASFIKRNLSPGGCADLLAVSLMFLFLESSHLTTPFN